MLAAYSRCLPGFCFMLLMKASLLAFVLILSFSNTWTEYICLYLGLIFPQMSNSHRHSNEEATCDLVSFFFFLGKISHIFSTDISRYEKVWRYNLKRFKPDMIYCTYVVNDEEFEVWLRCAPLINSALFLHTGEMTVHVQMLNKQWRHASSDGEKAVLNGWPSGFLILHSPHFSLGTIMSG